MKNNAKIDVEATAMMEITRPYDESYVYEILAAMPEDDLTPDEFVERCMPDINGGYAAEVREAGRRYFKLPARAS